MSMWQQRTDYWGRCVLCVLVGLVIFVFGFSTAGAADDAPEYEACVVQCGQTLESIANDYGVPADYLVRFNKLANSAAVTPGQVLMVPVVSQLAPQLPGGIYDATADAPNGKQMSGLLGTVVAERMEIRSHPDGGRVIFRNATRGTELLVIGQSEKQYAVLMSDGTLGWLPKSAMALSQRRMLVDKPATAPPMFGEPTGRQDIVDAAMKYLGIPYKYGGTLPDSVDCSLLVQTVFKQFGLKMPRTAAQQFLVGTPVAQDELIAGDRLYFYDKSGKIGHTAIYMGDDRFVHASSNRGAVAVDALSNPTYARKYAGARR